MSHSNRHFADAQSSSGGAIQVQSSSSSLLLLSLITADCHCISLKNRLLIEAQGVAERAGGHLNIC